MATIKGTPIKHPWSNIAEVWKWEGVSESDTCSEIVVPHKSDKSVQVIGNFGAGGVIDIEGAVLPEGLETDLAVLTDIAGAALNVGDKTPRVIGPNVSRLRPKPSAGTSVLVDIVLVITG